MTDPAPSSPSLTLQQLRDRIEALRRITPSDMEPEDHFNANGEYVCLAEVLAVLAPLIEQEQKVDQKINTHVDSQTQSDQQATGGNNEAVRPCAHRISWCPDCDNEWCDQCGEWFGAGKGMRFK